MGVMRRIIDAIMTRTATAPNLDPGFWRFGSPLFRDPRKVDGYTQNPWGYGGIGKIAEAVMSVPARAYTGDAADPQPLPDSHPLAAFLESPNPQCSAAELWERTTTELFRFGAVAWVLIGKAGRMTRPEYPTEAWLLAASRIKAVDKDGKAVGDRIGARIANWETTDGTLFAPHEVILFALPSCLAPLSAAHAAVRSNSAAEEWNAAFLENGADPGGWIKVPGSITPDQEKQILGKWNDDHGGPSKRGRTAIVKNGADFIPNPRTQKDIDYIEGLRWSRDEILAALGVPKAMLSITDDLNYATAVAQRRVFWESRVLPLLSRYRDAIYTQCLKQVDPAVWVDFDTANVAALQSDFGERVSQASTLVALGWSPEQANERLSLGMPEPDGGDFGDILTPAEAAGETADPAIAAGAPVADTALNGARVQSLVDIAAQVAAGTLPAATAKAIIQAAYPTIDPAKASAIIDPADGFAPPADAGEDAAGEAASDAAGANGAPAPGAQPAQSSAVRRRGAAMVGDRQIWIADHLRKVIIPGEARFSRATRAYLRAQSDDQRQRIADLVRRLGLKTDDVAALSPSDIDAVLIGRSKWDAAIKDALGPEIERITGTAAKAIAGEMGTVALAPTSQPMLELHAKLFAGLVRINETSRKRVRSVLLKAVSEGDTVGEMAERLRQSSPISSPVRALRIARTETGMAASATRFEAMKDAGIEKHEWVNAGDAVVRDSHAAVGGVGGEVVAIGERFSNGLLYPHEFGADPSELVNCRCDAVAAE